MREIKFREWDPVREEMMPGHGMSYSKREEFDDSVGFRFEHEEDLDYTTRQKETDEYGTPLRVLEQYVGLKDRDERDIYEGDIIESGLKYPRVFVISWSEGDAAFVAGTQKIFYVAKHGKILGNIHENPELLEGE